jgi:hypothetical protein
MKWQVDEMAHHKLVPLAIKAEKKQDITKALSWSNFQQVFFGGCATTLTQVTLA